MCTNLLETFFGFRNKFGGCCQLQMAVGCGDPSRQANVTCCWGADHRATITDSENYSYRLHEKLSLHIWFLKQLQTVLHIILKR